MIVLRDEALCPNRLLAVTADEAGLVPAVALVFHFPSTCNETRASIELLDEIDAVCSSCLPGSWLSVKKNCSYELEAISCSYQVCMTVGTVLGF